MDLFTAYILLLAVALPTAFYWGWLLHGYFHTPISTQDIEGYIKRTIPDEWTAYKKGVHEGYEQGLRDGQVPL